MCTAVTFKKKDSYFGRTLDVWFNVKPSVVITPRNYEFKFLNKAQAHVKNYAMIGMAIDMLGYPLYFDATNEVGLSMAGLNFPGNAYFGDNIKDKNNVCAFEIIPYILHKCKDVTEAKLALANVNITGKAFAMNMPKTPLHWIISDKEDSITVEQTKEGLKIFDNPVGALTNNPTFDWHMTNLINYMNVTSKVATNRLCEGVNLEPYCKGMGGIGLPGDLSSASRFIRVVFTKYNSDCGDSEEEVVSQFFHILGSVEQAHGCAEDGDGGSELTLYTSCVNVDKGIFYYKTYDNHQINAVDMNKEDLEGKKLIKYEVNFKSNINYQN